MSTMAILSVLIAIYGFSFLFLPEGAGSDEIRERFWSAPWAGFGHTFGGGLALLLGPIQFSRRIRRRWISVHRWTGRAYALAVIAGGVSGLYLSTVTFGGAVATAGFGMLAILWLISIGFAWIRIRQGDKRAHRIWMIRNFSLTLAAVSLRFILPALTAGFELPFEQAYMSVAWLCWVPNLIVAEWVILRRP